ncbi:MAG: insulinase family protein [Oscillospiraceae bacterium]|nr:insulinase family protein [Oscillospiraceae bacterium]
MVEIMTLPNGVRIACEPMSAVRSAAVGIWVGAGSRCERPGEEGSAHFIEHMLFKGTKSSSASELAGRMDAIGGQINAFTTRDTTCFYARVLDTHLDKASDILSEMFFDSLFREEDVLSERGVVLEEIDMYRDTPEDVVVEQLLAKVFPGALGRPVLGKVSSLETMTGASLRAFKEREYSPERIVVSLCGSFSDADVQRLADRFSVLPSSRPNPVRKSAYKSAVTARRRATEQNHFCLTWPGLPDGHPDRFAWQVMNTVLGGGMSSRLFQTIREKHGLCYSIGSFTSSFRETGLLAVSTAVNRDAEKKALALIRSEADRFRESGITPDELPCAREQLKSGIVLAMESTSARMNRLGSAILLMGRCLSVDEIIERYDAVTAEDVLRMARQTLTPEGLGFSALGRLGDTKEYLGILR